MYIYIYIDVLCTHTHTLIWLISSTPGSVSMITLLGLERGHRLCGGNLAPWSHEALLHFWWMLGMLEMLGMCLFLLKFSFFTTRAQEGAMIDFGCLVQASPVRKMVYWGHVSYYLLNLINKAASHSPQSRQCLWFVEFHVAILRERHSCCSLHRCQGMLPKSEIVLLAKVSRESWHHWCQSDSEWVGFPCSSCW